jgi:hypothetical protein
MAKVNVCMGIWGVGGAERFWERLARKLPQYTWAFTTEVQSTSNLIVYSNDHRFYLQARNYNLPTIQRMTGPRSYTLPQPLDLAAVVCSSKAGFEVSQHPRKQLIYNGIDLGHLKTIKPIPCDLLYAPARNGKGQCIETAIQYAQEQRRSLTVLGDRQHLAENTAEVLRRRYPKVNWPGLVAEDVALGYVKGCNEAIMPTPVHGVSNFLIEAVALHKPIINLGNAEIPLYENLDLNNTAAKYQELFERVLDEGIYKV